MNAIKIKQLLPRVFDGMQTVSPVRDSQLWLHEYEFERGRRYLVMAESGTGKSSLCSFIYGSRRDYLGQIDFDGRDISTLSVNEWSGVRRTELGYLPQEMGLFATMTALDNIMLKNRQSDRYSESEIIRMMQRLEIDNRADYPAGRMSVGQQQRVAIIRALCQPMSFLILDEPVSHLDERNNRIVAEMVDDCLAECGAGLIATSVGNHLLIDNPVRVRL